jgi:ATP-dependent Clp protease ATP-binding subunit ClpX
MVTASMLAICYFSDRGGVEPTPFAGDSRRAKMCVVSPTRSIDVPRGDIVFIDEFDQIRTSGPAFKDVRLGVQRGLLKKLELTVPPVGGFTRPQQPSIPFGTTNVLLICGGAFVDLEDLSAKKLDQGGIGFHQLSETCQVPVDGLLRR